MHFRALFLSKPTDDEILRQELQPFVDGQLDESVTEWHPIPAPSELQPVRVPYYNDDTNRNGGVAPNGDLQVQTVNETNNILQKDEEELLLLQEQTRQFATSGLAVVKLQDYLNMNSRNENTCKNSEKGIDNDDDFLRSRVEQFWNSSHGTALLQARFGNKEATSSSQNSTAQPSLIILPTHVTRRKAPPDNMSLVHIDYPSTHDLVTLTSEWWSRWKRILPKHHKVWKAMYNNGNNTNDNGSTKKKEEEEEENIHTSTNNHGAMKRREDEDALLLLRVQEDDEVDAQEFSSHFHLVGVVTTWICLQPQHGERIRNYPLLVADASSVKEEHNLNTYRVGKKHSVGVEFDPELQWFHAPDMVRGDAWCFDTMKCPHVSVDLNNNVEQEKIIMKNGQTTTETLGDFVRESAEVRSLVLMIRKKETQITTIV